ncbi:hypothetical protein KAS31_00200 [Candidatus Parcubacteria bacterium]|nr:hypothetical protein [Candidatus Parcubacteria bacterium]
MIVKYYRKNDIFSFKNNLINFYPVGNIKNNRLNKRLFELGDFVENIRTKFMNLALDKDIFIPDLKS